MSLLTARYGIFIVNSSFTELLMALCVCRYLLLGEKPKRRASSSHGFCLVLLTFHEPCTLFQIQSKLPIDIPLLSKRTCSKILGLPKSFLNHFCSVQVLDAITTVLPSSVSVVALITKAIAIILYVTKR